MRWLLRRPAIAVLRWLLDREQWRIRDLEWELSHRAQPDRSKLLFSTTNMPPSAKAKRDQEYTAKTNRLHRQLDRSRRRVAEWTEALNRAQAITSRGAKA